MILIHSIPGIVVSLWMGQVNESNMIFSEHTVAPYINQVWNESDVMITERMGVLTCLY